MSRRVAQVPVLAKASQGKPPPPTKPAHILVPAISGSCERERDADKFFSAEVCFQFRDVLIKSIFVFSPTPRPKKPQGAQRNIWR